ncbi:MAG: hypothetical protein GVY13_05050 [Alphaproteobacteria bacterium]|jgi:hypothetical protein|nr:hypothetical protein [Alphaproteobacteria bacterium]
MTLPPARAAALFGGLAVYGAFSSPTPDDPGLAELAAALLLLAAVGPGRAVAVGAGAWLAVREARAWHIVGTLALVALVWVPSLLGAADGAPAARLLRDALPLLFLFIPLFLAAADGSPGRDRALGLALLCGLAAIGLLFAGRFFLITGVTPGVAQLVAPSDGLLYLANSPAVLFAAIFLPLGAMASFGETGRSLGVRLAVLVGGLAGGGLCLAALAATLQRAALAAAALAFALYALRAVLVRPAALVPLSALALAIWVAAGPYLAGVYELLALKTELVGFNQHGAEIAVAGGHLAASLTAALIGGGWGLLLETPAVPGYRVAYLHALPLYMTVKTGLIGTLLLLAYLAMLACAAPGLWRHAPALCLAVLAPLAVGFLVQPSFKYLTYGLLLAILTPCVIPLAGLPHGRRTQDHPTARRCVPGPPRRTRRCGGGRG